MLFTDAASKTIALDPMGARHHRGDFSRLRRNGDAISSCQSESKPLTERQPFPQRESFTRPEPFAQSNTAAQLQSNRHGQHEYRGRRRFIQPELTDHQRGHAGDLD